MELAHSSLNRADLTEQTYIVVRESILKRTLLPGQRISVEDIARQLGVSRTPVMDALKRLAADGLVEIVPRRGTFVTTLTAQDLAEYFDIRIMIELYAADRILTRGVVDAFLEDIQVPLRNMNQAIVNGDYRDYDAFMTSDRDLHMRLVRWSENQRLLNMYSDLNVHIQVMRAHYLEDVENARQAQEEHEAIVQAFKSRDRERVSEALRTHITNVSQRILELLQDRGGKL